MRSELFLFVLELFLFCIDVRIKRVCVPAGQPVSVRAARRAARADNAGRQTLAGYIYIYPA